MLAMEILEEFLKKFLENVLVELAVKFLEQFRKKFPLDFRTICYVKSLKKNMEGSKIWNVKVFGKINKLH